MIICVAQAFDYYISLRLDDGKLVVRQLIKVLHVLLVLESRRSYKYSGSIVMYLLTVVYQRVHNLPHWQMFEKQASLFSEETGEQAFSVLSRCVLGDTTKNKFEHLNSMYALIHSYLAVSDDLRNDIDMQGPRGSWRKVHKQDGPETVETEAFLRSLVRKLRHNTWSVYDGSKTAYANGVQAAQHQVPRQARTPLYQPDAAKAKFHATINSLALKFKSLVWAYKIRVVWPEFEHVPADMEHEAREQLPSSGDDEDPQPVLVARARPRKKSKTGKDVAWKPADGETDSEEGSPEREEVPDREDENKHETDEPTGLFDKDSRGEVVSWKEWGGVSARNISSRARSERPNRGVRRGDPYFPILHSVPAD